MHCHTPHTQKFLFYFYYFFYLFFSLFYFLSFVLTSVRRCEAFSLLRNLVPKFSKFRIKVWFPRLRFQIGGQKRMRGMQCGAGRAFEKSAAPPQRESARDAAEGSRIDRGSSGRMCAKSARSPSMAQVSPGGTPGLRRSSGVVGGGPLGRTSRVFFCFFLENVKKIRGGPRAPSARDPTS